MSIPSLNKITSLIHIFTTECHHIKNYQRFPNCGPKRANGKLLSSRIASNINLSSSLIPVFKGICPCSSSTFSSGSKGPKLTWQTVPGFGSVPSKKYCRTCFIVHIEGDDNEQCWNVRSAKLKDLRGWEIKKIILTPGEFWVRTTEWLYPRDILCALL